MDSRSSGCCQSSEIRLYNTLKACLLIYNFLFMLIGFTVIGLGIYAEVMREELVEINHVFFTPSVFLFCLGAVASLFASIGFVGALRDNMCVLRLFAVSVVIFILLEIGAGVCALVYKDPAKSFVSKFIQKGLATYYDDQDLKNIVDYVQKEFHCCGGRIYKDWESNRYHNCSAPGPSACGVPYSCCIRHPDDDIIINSMCGYDTIALEPFEAGSIIYLYGCVDAVLDYVWGHFDVLAGLLLGLFLPQAVGIFLALFYLDVLKRIIASMPAPEEEPVLL